jgi:hypothetical protein
MVPKENGSVKTVLGHLVLDVVASDRQATPSSRKRNGISQYLSPAQASDLRKRADSGDADAQLNSERPTTRGTR